MDLWNNDIGRKYGAKAKTRNELLKSLIKALEDGELIVDPSDPRKYKGEAYIKRKLRSLVIKIMENKTGANILFYDVYEKKVMSKEEFLSLIKAGEYLKYSFKVVDGVEIPISKRDRFEFNNLG